MLKVALQITSTALSRWTLAPGIAIHAVRQNSRLHEIPDLMDEVGNLLGCLGLSRETDLKIITLPLAPRPLTFALSRHLPFALCPLPFALCLGVCRLSACLSICLLTCFHSEALYMS